MDRRARPSVAPRLPPTELRLHRRHPARGADRSPTRRPARARRPIRTPPRAHSTRAVPPQHTPAPALARHGIRPSRGRPPRRRRSCLQFDPPRIPTRRHWRVAPVRRHRAVAAGAGASPPRSRPRARMEGPMGQPRILRARRTRLHADPLARVFAGSSAESAVRRTGRLRPDVSHAKS